MPAFGTKGTTVIYFNKFLQIHSTFNTILILMYNANFKYNLTAKINGLPKLKWLNNFIINAQ